MQKVKDVIAQLRYGLPESFGVILMLHHVTPIDRRRLCANDAYKVSPEFLSMVISTLKSRGYAFLSMDEAVEAVVSRRMRGRFVVLTFDDGYVDNFQVGLPILEAENVPGIVYVSTGLSCGDAPVWWDALEDHLLATDEMRMPDGRRVSCVTQEAKNTVLQDLSQWVKQLPPSEVVARVSSLCGRTIGWFDEYKNRLADTETLSRYASHRLMALGSHTHSHLPCGGNADEAVISDIARSLTILRGLGANPRHFAFPFGDDMQDNERFTYFFESQRILSAVVTTPGLLLPEGGNRYRLPRIMLSEYEGLSRKRIHDIWKWQRNLV